MYTQQFIKSVKKIFLWYFYGRFREQIFKRSTILTVPENRLTKPSPADVNTVQPRLSEH